MKNCKIIGYKIRVNTIRVVRRIFYKLLLKQKEPKLIWPENYIKKKKLKEKKMKQKYTVSTKQVEIMYGESHYLSCYQRSHMDLFCQNSYSQVSNNRGLLINMDLENSVKYNKQRSGINGGLFVYFDSNDVNVSEFAYVRTKLYLQKV